MNRTTLRPWSKKQEQRIYSWHKIKAQRVYVLAEKYSVVICEYCGRAPWGNELGILDGHHIDGNRKNNTPDNCLIVHRSCHQHIHDNNIQANQLGFKGINYKS